MVNPIALGMAWWTHFGLFRSDLIAKAFDHGFTPWNAGHRCRCITNSRASGEPASSCPRPAHRHLSGLDPRMWVQAKQADIPSGASMTASRHLSVSLLSGSPTRMACWCSITRRSISASLRGVNLGGCLAGAGKGGATRCLALALPNSGMGAAS